MSRNNLARMSISVYPLGTGKPGISEELSIILDILQKSGLAYEVTLTGTNVEGSLDELFPLAKRLHENMFSDQVKRVLTLIKIDERRDR